MVTYSDIITAINTKINARFPSIKFDTKDIEIEAIDVKNKIIRPSFRVSLDSTKSSNFMNVAKDRNMTIRVYYFPTNKDKYRIEILDIQDQLENLFIDDNTIIINDDFIIEIYESEFDVVDGVLHFYFNIQLSEDFNRTDDRELMEDVDFKENIK